MTSCHPITVKRQTTNEQESTQINSVTDNTVTTASTTVMLLVMILRSLQH